MNITHCPTAYLAGCNSRQGRSISEADKAALREHDLIVNRKSYAAAARAAVRMKTLHERSPRSRRKHE